MVALNLVVVGYLAVWPILLVLITLHQTIGVELGLTKPDLKFGNDGLGFHYALVATGLLFYAITFAVVNFPLARWFRISTWRFWLTAFLLSTVLTVVVQIDQRVWHAIKWY